MKEPGSDVSAASGTRDSIITDSAGIQYIELEAGGYAARGHRDGKEVSGTLEFSTEIDNGSGVFPVTTIFNNGYLDYSKITDIKIPESVTTIEVGAFQGCSSLNNVVIPENVTRLDGNAFCNCSSLTNIKLPSNLKRLAGGLFSGCTSMQSIEIPNSVEIIGAAAFEKCSSLTSIEIPEKVTELEPYAFAKCTNLESAEIPKTLSKIERLAFSDCYTLTTLYIIVDPSKPITPPEVEENTFDDTPFERYIVFLAEDGTKLTGDDFEKAAAAYLADSRDWNANDEFWWGWKIKEPSAVESTYQVATRVKKDTDDWENHGRTFALRADGGAEFLTDLSHVPNGTYHIYDITGIRPDSYWSKAVDTGRDVTVDGVDTTVDVTVENADIEAEINYYTVTFYDGAAAYQAGTAQEPQIVLPGQFAEEPERPQKAACRFVGWKTEYGGSTAFDFSRAVSDTTRIYASWADDSAPVDTYTITATAGEGGSISPSGTVSVEEGEDERFTITPDDGYRIKTVMVDDGKNVTAELVDSVTRAQTGASKDYVFFNVSEDHTITASFEKESGDDTPGDDNPGGNDNPGGGDDNPGDDTPGGGEEPDGEKKPGGNESGGKRNPDDGNSDNGNGEGNSEENTQTVAVVTTASPQTVNNTAGTEEIPDEITDKKAPGEKEPKTGDASTVEIYATVAMIAGLTYLLLYFMEEGRGMTEREKEVFVAAFIRWAKKGGRFRRCCAMAAIFCLLVYYHSIGKRAGREINREYLRQAV